MWTPFEILPKSRDWREWPKRPAFLLGIGHLPLAEPRRIWMVQPSDEKKTGKLPYGLPCHDLHDSVYERMDFDAKYRPPNVMEYLEQVQKHMDQDPKNLEPYQKYMKFLEEKKM